MVRADFNALQGELSIDPPIERSGSATSQEDEVLIGTANFWPNFWKANCSTLQSSPSFGSDEILSSKRTIASSSNPHLH